MNLKNSQFGTKLVLVSEPEEQPVWYKVSVGNSDFGNSRIHLHANAATITRLAKKSSRGQMSQGLRDASVPGSYILLKAVLFLCRSFLVQDSTRKVEVEKCNRIFRVRRVHINQGKETTPTAYLSHVIQLNTDEDIRLFYHSLHVTFVFTFTSPHLSHLSIKFFFSIAKK